MSSSLNQDLKGETSIRSQKTQNDMALLSASGLLQHNNNFCLDHQNDGNLNGYHETPSTPYQLQVNRNNLLIQSSNNLQIPFSHKDNLQFSPTNELIGQANSMFSPPNFCNNRDEQLVLQSSNQFLHHQNFLFSDYDLNDIQGTPFPPNGGNYSRYNHSYTNYQKHNSFQNSQRNTPLQTISPLGILQSGGRIHQHAQMSTPNNIPNFTLQSAHNNLFSQTMLPHSPFNTNRDYQQFDYGLYNNIDAFEDMSLQNWVDKNKDSDDDEQQYNKLKKKQKIEEKVEMAELNDQDNDMNSYTQEEKDVNNQLFGSKSTAKKQANDHSKVKQQNGQQKFDKYNRELTSSQKTMKQNFQISPQNDRYLSTTITPNKNIPGNFDYTTPSMISRQSKLEEDHLEDQNRCLSNRQQLRSNIVNDNGNCDSDEEKGGKRNQRGLRVLSMKVKDIVCELKETTYKSVAEYLLKDLEAKKQNNETFVKDEQNIKRRVYDALNVLIAAQVLTKNGKKVKADHTLPKGKSTSQYSQQKKEYLETALKLKRDRLERKQETMNDLMIKITALQSLCERNIQIERKNKEFNGSKQSNSKGNSSQQLKCLSLQNGTSINQEEGTAKKLKFPFIGVYSPSNNSRISFKKFSSGLVVSSIQQLNLKGDIDILVQLYKESYSQFQILKQQTRYMDPQLLQFMGKLQHTLKQSSEADKQENTLQQLQKEIIIRNNKHIEQHHFNNSNTNGNTQKIIKRQMKQQQINDQYSQDEESSQETFNQPNQFSVKAQDYQSPQPQEYNQNNNSNDYEDSNQLVNDYMNMS